MNDEWVLISSMAEGVERLEVTQKAGWLRDWVGQWEVMSYEL